MALSWYKITPPRRFGHGSHFVKASDKKDALMKGVRMYRRMTKKYDMIPPGPIRMGEFKAVKISNIEAIKEDLSPAQKSEWRSLKYKK